MSTPLEAIRSLRRAGLSQAEISRRTGIPQPRVCRWEAGNVPATANDAVKLVELAASIEAKSGDGAACASGDVPSCCGRGRLPLDRRTPEDDADWVACPARRATDKPELVARQRAPLGQAPEVSDAA